MLREEKQLTQIDLADLSGLDVSTISKIERGHLPLFANADELSLILEVPVEILFPFYMRRSPLPGWRDVMYLKSCGCDISAYAKLKEFLKTVDSHPDGYRDGWK